MKNKAFDKISGKRALSVLLVMALAVPAFWLGNPLSPSLRASADTYRKGYVLEAETSDRTGIFPDTTFLLTLPEAEHAAFAGTEEDAFRTAKILGELKKRLVLRNPPVITTPAESGEPTESATPAESSEPAESATPAESSELAESAEPTPSGAAADSGTPVGSVTPAAFTLHVEPAGKNTYRVTPSHRLAANTLYFFDMTASDGEVIPFAFQTRKEFGVVGTLPAHQSAYVPVDTGIEVYFSHTGITLDKAHFSITPAVDGRFETHGNAVAFVPRKPLAPGTLYTITVKEGLPLAGTEEKLPADLTFSFETNPDETKSANPDQGWLSIGNNWLEFPTNSKPSIPFNLSLPASLQTDGKADLGVTVFRYADVQAFVKALDQRDDVPYWAWWSYSQNLLETKNLTTQLTYKQSINFNTMPATWTELPETLTAGFYLVELQAGATDAPLKAQALLQVTDTSAWFIEDADKTLFWLNSLKTKGPLSGFTVESLSSGASGKTDAKGLAELKRQTIPESKTNQPEYYLLRHENGDVSVYNSGYPSLTGSAVNSTLRFPAGGQEGNYWRYTGLDRTLYKPADTVKFWGFARHRVTGKSPETVTVEIAQGGWMYPWMNARASFWMPMLQKPLMAFTLPVNNGFWDGSTALPNLEPGYYTLSVKQGDEVISTSGFSVENYVKPAWQITATADKKAVKPGETARFTIKAAFFDGTPVANQLIRYNLQEPDGFREGEGKTDVNGNLTVSYEAKFFTGQQGQWWTSLYATAELPETGEVSASTQVQIFLNDIWVDIAGDIVNAEDADDFTTLPLQNGNIALDAKIAPNPKPVDISKDRVGRIVAQVNLVDLDPLNRPETSGEAGSTSGSTKDGRTMPVQPDQGDFRGAPRAGQVLRATVTRTTWERVETGEDYDFVNKVVIPRYEYREKRETFATGTITSDAQGRAVFTFPIPAGTEGYFSAKVDTEDAQKHPMTFEVWMSSNFGYPDQSVWHTLETDKPAYRDGETVTANIIRNDKKLLTGQTLFVTSWQGIQSYNLVSSPTHQLTFEEKMAPNLTLDGVLFDGSTYISVQNSVRYDAEEKRITFNIQADREDYRPGDTVTLTLTAKDPDGKPVPATVNISLVDEALLKLSDQYTNVLETLYGWMDNGIVRRAGNGGSPMYPMYGGRGGMMDLNVAMESAAMPAPSMMASAPVMTFSKGATEAGAADASYVVRSDFRDTAYFTTTTLDATGKGTLSFTLPHNITDWRVTVSGISTALHGGNGEASTIVSQPFFLSETLNATYLAGDAPQVGLTAYGTALAQGEDVTFGIRSTDLPGLNGTVTGKAFERVHLPLGELKEGTYKVVLTAKTASGKTDAVERTVTVVGSYREMTKSVQVALANGMTVPAGTKGLTRISITDPERAALLDTLYGLAWRNGHRLDQRLVSSSAQRWLNELMEQAAEGKPEETYGLFDPETVDVISYQREDGGYGILPYAESDLRMTALLTSLLAENGSTESLKAWYYNTIYSGDATAAAPALYGLAVLGEPVLTELQTAATVKTATPENRLFLIMGLAAVGDLPAARALWDTHIAPLLETADPYVRLKASGADKDENLSLTALASTAAASLRLPAADGLHAWVRSNPSKNVFTGPEDLMWVKTRFQSLPAAALSFTWTYAGKTNNEDLKNGAVAFITVPSQLIGDLKISGVTGTGVLTSTFTAPLEGVGKETQVSLTRAYYNQATGQKTNTFKMNDLVRVELTWNISAEAMDGVYEISDWLPAGLAPIDNPWQYGIKPPDSFWYRSFEGQQADFVVGRDWNLSKKITYYARVTSPGTYTAEGSVMRGSMVRDSVLGIASDRIEITTK